ncbi:hypothetical protein MHYP_G00173930 [Metynnis hypsauchen]
MGHFLQAGRAAYMLALSADVAVLVARMPLLRKYRQVSRITQLTEQQTSDKNRDESLNLHRLVELRCSRAVTVQTVYL